MNRGPDEPTGPDHTADQFEAIVAGWRREGAVPRVARRRAAAHRAAAHPDHAHAPGTALPGRRRPPRSEADRLDHFVPPEPPPLPRIGPPARSSGSRCSRSG